MTNFQPKVAQASLLARSSQARRRESRSKFCRPAGVTLIELLVVISIIGILTAMVTSGYMTMRAQQKMNTNVDKVTSLLHTARNMAISNNLNYVYYIDYPKIGVCQESDFNSSTGMPNDGATLVDLQVLEEEFKVNDHESVTFHPDGSAAGTSMLIPVISGSATQVEKGCRIIRVYQGGMIKNIADGIVMGTITDISGVVPSAQVIITPPGPPSGEKNITIPGTYAFSGRSGIYKLEVFVGGISKFGPEDVTITDGKAITLDITL